MEKKASIIIPNYRRKTVFRAVASVLQGTFPVSDLEVIVIDDGSSDGSFDCIQKIAGCFGDSLKVFENCVNAGPGTCRNQALDMARGEYLFFLDSDDFFSPDGLEDFIMFADATGCDVVLGKKVLLDGRIHCGTSTEQTKISADLIVDQVLSTVGPVSKLFSRSLIERYGLRFDEGRKWGEDQPFVVASYLLANRVGVMADKTYVHISLDDINLTASDGSLSNRIVTALRVLEIIDRFAGDRGVEYIAKLKAIMLQNNLAPVLRFWNGGGNILIQHGERDSLRHLAELHLTQIVRRELPDDFYEIFRKASELGG